LTGNVLVCLNPGNTGESIAVLLEGIVSECRTQLSAGNANTACPQVGESPTASSYSYLGSVRNLFSFIEVQHREPWHLLEAESALEKWETSKVAGLSCRTARRNLERYGPNMLPEAEPRSG
jgi:Ca2+-transporting ATPase